MVMHSFSLLYTRPLVVLGQAFSFWKRKQKLLLEAGIFCHSNWSIGRSRKYT